MGSFGFLWNCTSRTRVSFSAGRSLTGSYPLGAPSVTDMPGPSPFVFFRTPSCASSIAFSSQGKYRGKKMRTHKFIHISKLSLRFLRRLKTTEVIKVSAYLRCYDNEIIFRLSRGEMYSIDVYGYFDRSS